jgi:DNA-binding NarL/FixJ family response regulator
MVVSERVRILVVEDHPDMREAYRLLVDGEPDLEIQGEAESAEIALSDFDLEAADIVIVDVSLPGMNGLALIREIHRIRADLPVLVISGRGKPDNVNRAVEAGARGYMDKKGVGRRLAGAIRHVAAGGTYLADGDGDGAAPLEGG